MTFAGALCWALRLMPRPHDAKLRLGGHHEDPSDQADCPHLPCASGWLRAAHADGGIQARAADAEADGHGPSHGDAHADANRAAPNTYAQPHGHGDLHFHAHRHPDAFAHGNPPPYGHAPTADGDGNPSTPHSYPFADAHLAQHLGSLRVGAGSDAG